MTEHGHQKELDMGQRHAQMATGAAMVILFSGSDYSPAPTPPVVFSYEPPTGVISWHDKNGDYVLGGFGDYTPKDRAGFYQYADLPSLDVIHSIAGLASVTGLSTLPSRTALFDQGTGLITSLDASNCLLLNSIGGGGSLLADLNISGCVSYANLDIPATSGFGNVSSVDITGCTSLVVVSANGNKLPVNVVNAILVELLANGQTDGFTNLSGQTPPAPPTGAGADAVIALRALTPPWTVITD